MLKQPKLRSEPEREELGPHLPYGPLLTLGGRGLVSLLRISLTARTFGQNNILLYLEKGNMTQLSLLVMSM